MKSDWQDAPPRVRAPRAGMAGWRWLLLLTLLGGCAALWLGGSKTLVIDWHLLQQAVRWGESPPPGQAPELDLAQIAGQVQRAPAVATVPEHSATVAPQLGWQVEPAIRSGQQLRNEFSDHNYQPRAPDNLYSPPSYAAGRVNGSETPRRVQRQTPELTVESIKSWDGGTRYRAQWYSLANYIDGGTVCGNYRKGSIEYRECRKGAKQHFHEQCRLWRARYLEDRTDRSERMRQRYCSASSSFSPMG